MGTQPAVPKGGGWTPTQFSAHFYCDQTAGCIKMPLGMDVGLSPGDFVLDIEIHSRLSNKGRSPPNFWPVLLTPSGSMDQDATWYGTHTVASAQATVLDGDPAPSPQGGWSTLPNFRPISIVAKRLDASRCHLVLR